MYVNIHWPRGSVVICRMTDGTYRLVLTIASNESRNQHAYHHHSDLLDLQW
jgi:hypothetical protein